MDDATDKKTGDAPAGQIDRFQQVARELGGDENEEAFRDKLRVIARQKPKTDPISPAKPAPRRSRIDVDATTGQAWEQATASSHHKSK